MMRDKPGPQEVRHRRAFDMNGLCLLGGLNGVNIYIRVVSIAGICLFNDGDTLKCCVNITQVNKPSKYT